MASIWQKIGGKHHEYWPIWKVGITGIPAWFWYGIKSKNLTYFTAVNPAFEYSSFCQENKAEINKLIPAKYLPTTIDIEFPFRKEEIFTVVNEKLFFPFIAKPMFGGRGRLVQVINSKAELENYLSAINEPFVLQEQLPAEIELAVFFYKFPGEHSIVIPSIVQKEFLTVVGNGIDSIEQLMQKNYRSKIQTKRLLQEKKYLLLSIPKIGETVLLEPIGNHCKGTIFRNVANKVTPAFTKSINEICKSINQFNYGRFDLKITSWQEAEQGIGIKILELNGINADAAHIFDPNCTWQESILAQWQQAKAAYIIAKHNRQNGVKTIPFWKMISKVYYLLKNT